MANHYSAAQWQAWIEDCQRSEMTVAVFCKSIGVSVNTYYRWRQRLRSEPLNSDFGSVEFLPVSLPVVQVEIELPGGSIARIANDPNSLRPLVSLLLELGASK